MDQKWNVILMLCEGADKVRVTSVEERVETADNLPESARRVADALASSGIDAEIRIFERETRTAGSAAEALGCDVAQIVKSLVFMVGDTAVLALVSGVNRVDEAKLGALCHDEVRRATPDEVREVTGYAIGGVPPLGHSRPVETWVDEALMAYPVVWAAAGHPASVFPVSPGDLVRAVGGRIADLAESP